MPLLRPLTKATSNQGLQATANSLRSSLAPAISSASRVAFGYLKHPGMRRQVYKSARPLLAQKGYTSVRFAVGCSATRCVLQYLKPRRKAVGANMQSYGNV